jgi:hypothetical protein
MSNDNDTVSSSGSTVHRESAADEIRVRLANAWDNAERIYTGHRDQQTSSTRTCISTDRLRIEDENNEQAFIEAGPNAVADREANR